jgi:hypothetical protein
VKSAVNKQKTQKEKEHADLFAELVGSTCQGFYLT